MPAIKCKNGKWKWGEKGRPVFKTKEAAEAAGRAIYAKAKNRRKDK